MHPRHSAGRVAQAAKRPGQRSAMEAEKAELAPVCIMYTL